MAPSNIFDLTTYRKNINLPLKKMTVTYPIKNGKVLLAKKIEKGGMGEGYFLGIGGKLEPGESFKQGAVREVNEEVGIQIKNLVDMGKVFFYFPNKIEKEKWNVEVKIFKTRSWSGKPGKTSEMQPKYFSVNKIPYSKMWEDNQLWLPLILQGKRIEAHFIYNKDNVSVKEYNIKFL